MNLSTKQKRVLLRHFRSKLPNGHMPNCLVCGHREWTILGLTSSPKVQLLLNKETSSYEANESDEVVPLLSVACNNCHYVIQFAWALVVQDDEDG
ncbi:hypothetical protein [Sorangium sp. So ce1099]|uniref:hypothetical protein n=1 Tax=Sorangium sp. So ce1099 TaxID=3133331 RepID=UPI003F5FDE4B